MIVYIPNKLNNHSPGVLRAIDKLNIIVGNTIRAIIHANSVKCVQHVHLQFSL